MIVPRTPDHWEELGVRLYKMLKVLNGDEEPDLDAIKGILGGPLPGGPINFQAYVGGLNMRA